MQVDARRTCLSVILALTSAPTTLAFTNAPGVCSRPASDPRLDVHVHKHPRGMHLHLHGLQMMAPPPKVKSSYYKRPSAALERGGGFYVPGLEGLRLRIAVASVLTVGLVLNRVLSPTGGGAPASSQLVSESLGAIGIAFVFAQSAIQSSLEAEMQRDELRAAFVSRLSEVQEIGASLGDGQRPLTSARARWAASALLKLTPARAAVWVDASGEVLLRFGRFPDEASTSSGGSLQSTLLASSGASEEVWTVELNSATPPSPLPSNAECVAACRCGGGVFAIASERPAAFAPEHLAWVARCKRLIEMDPSSA